MPPERVPAPGRPSRRKPASRAAHAHAGSTTFDRARFEARLRAGLQELQLLPQAEQQQQALTDRLLAYLALLAKWNQTYNLTAIRDPADMLGHHLLDSASIVRPLLQRMEQRRADPARRLRLVDIGSGAGLPGLVMALLAPQLDVVLVEPVGKKAAFLRQTAAELALTNVQVEATRAQALPESVRTPPPDAIVCRAFASLPDYLTAIAGLVGPETIVAAMKAAVPTDEIAALPPGWAVDEVIELVVPGVAVERHLILLAARPARPVHAPAAATAQAAHPFPLPPPSGPSRP